MSPKLSIACIERERVDLERRGVPWNTVDWGRVGVERCVVELDEGRVVQGVVRKGVVGGEAIDEARVR